MIIVSFKELVFSYLVFCVCFVAMWEMWKSMIRKTLRAFGYRDLKEWYEDIKDYYFRK